MKDFLKKIKADYLMSSFVCILLGILLLFHRGAAVNFVFIGCGILTIIEGGLILFNTFSEELF